MSVRLVGVFAHPDDDAYLLGGTLLVLGEAVEPTFVFATSGGAGPITDPFMATRETLAEVREREQRGYLEEVGRRDARVHFLRHPDYYLPDVPVEQLMGEIEDVLRDVRPNVVITFGPDGITSHHDHIRVGLVATEAFHRARQALGEPDDSFLRLYHTALARSDVDRFYQGVAEGGFGLGQEGVLFNPTGIPDERIAVRVDCRPVFSRKLAGILRHRTQLVEFERVPEPLRWIYLDTECFVQVVPSARPGDRPRAGLLDDLDLDRLPSSGNP